MCSRHRVRRIRRSHGSLGDPREKVAKARMKVRRVKVTRARQPRLTFLRDVFQGLREISLFAMGSIVGSAGGRASQADAREVYMSAGRMDVGGLSLSMSASIPIERQGALQALPLLSLPHNRPGRTSRLPPWVALCHRFQLRSWRLQFCRKVLFLTSRCVSFCRLGQTRKVVAKASSFPNPLFQGPMSFLEPRVCVELLDSSRTVSTRALRSSIILCQAIRTHLLPSFRSLKLLCMWIPITCRGVLMQFLPFLIFRMGV